MRHGTSARSNFSVIPARVSGAREESRIPLEDVGKDRDSSRGQPRARMTEQEIERDRNCHYDLQRLSWLRISPHVTSGRASPEPDCARRIRMGGVEIRATSSAVPASPRGAAGDGSRSCTRALYRYSRLIGFV